MLLHLGEVREDKKKSAPSATTAQPGGPTVTSKEKTRSVEEEKEDGTVLGGREQARRSLSREENDQSMDEPAVFGRRSLGEGRRTFSSVLGHVEKANDSW